MFSLSNKLRISKKHVGILSLKLYDAYNAAHADKNKENIQDEVNILSQILKSSDNVETEVDSKLKYCKEN